MAYLGSISQNIFQSFLDLIFPKVITLLRRCVLVLFRGYIKKRKNIIEEEVLNELKQNEYFRVLRLASITNTPGIKANNKYRDFFFDIPEDYKSELEKPEYRFRSNYNANDNNELDKKLRDFISKNYPTINVEELIEKAKTEIASTFLCELKKGLSKSNNQMLGVDSIDDSSPNLDLSLFTTDYYTYKCLCYIYKELRSINSEPLIVQTIDDVNRISPFMCSFAIGGFLSLNLHNEEVYFLGRRSSTVACPNTWHISFDETFDLRDRIQKQGYPYDINICLERGIREELGFQVFDYNFVYDITALSVIQNDTRCELELFVLSHCKLKNIKEFNNIIFQMYSAPDFENENDNIQLIKANDIISFYGNKIKLGEHTTDEAIPLWQFFSLIRAHRNKLDKFLNKIQD